MARTMLPTLGGGGPASKPVNDNINTTGRGGAVKVPASKPYTPPKQPARPATKPVVRAYTPAVPRSPVSAPKPVAKAAPKPAAPKPPAKPVAPSEPDWLAGDSAYQAVLTALGKQLSNFNTDLDTQLGNYSDNYAASLKDLGYKPGLDGATGTWDFENPLTASGRANENLVNDFAARGMLQSTGYVDAQNQLQTSLMDQLKQLNTARDQFSGGLANQRSAFTDQTDTAKQQAMAESIARRAAKFGLM